MKAPGSAVLLRIYTDENALIGDRSLVDDIVRHAREAGLAGATVLRAIQGFGESAHVHQRRAFNLNDNLPVVIEIVDEENRRLVAVGVIDNLVKGAAGAAVQNLNVMCGFPEATCLEGLPLWP